ncbi:MAG: right-handed parallel beta-helix repeat-containing protein [Armatimonadetes bacterium]|nr:right-handed parallel beta-helix repeat-containing protein [Armatimonadota bacterium]
MRLLLAVLAVLPLSAAELAVSTTPQLTAAIARAQPGDEIVLAPGDYEPGVRAAGLRGTEGQPITLRGRDQARPPLFRGGSVALHLSDPAWVTLQDIAVESMRDGGLNIDDGGSADTPAHHVTLRRVTVRDVGPTGNRDGIKLSGIDDFTVEGCLVERWGNSGSAIDMVGCHRGLIVGCTFREGASPNASGVQAKGGSADVTIRACLFQQAGGRPVNLGGSTGPAFFRPADAPHEAKNLTVEGCLFLGGFAPLCFVGVDGAVVRCNTIVDPGRWALRILQESTDPRFTKCRAGRVTDNIIVFHAAQWASGGVNIGGGTEPGSFVFERNLWYCVDRPAASRPSLPSTETDGVYGQDPRFRDAEQGDYRVADDGPGQGKGFEALPAR